MTESAQFYFDESRFPKQLDWSREEDHPRGFFGGSLSIMGPARLFIDGRDIGHVVKVVE